MPIYKNSDTATLIVNDIYGIPREIDPGENVATYEILSTPWVLQSTKPKFNPCTFSDLPAAVGSGTLETYTTIPLTTDVLRVENNTAFNLTLLFGDATNTPATAIPAGTKIVIPNLKNKVQWARLVTTGAVVSGEVVIDGFIEGVLIS